LVVVFVLASGLYLALQHRCAESSSEDAAALKKTFLKSNCFE
jgi:hypothetical protein